MKIDLLCTVSGGACGNLVTRQDVLTSETESFAYDFIDRLTSVSVAYVPTSAYYEIDNMINLTILPYFCNEITTQNIFEQINSRDYTYPDHIFCSG